jgi:hypothetical protein
MLPVLDDDLAPSVVAHGEGRPVFVDESGLRARWCRRLLGACAVVALAFVLTVAVLGVAFTRSPACDAWAGPDRAGHPAAAGPAAPGCRP